MPEQIPFIGRQDEIALIENLIKEWNTRRVLFLNGPGGIGKTRLLEEVHKQYRGAQDIPLLVADILDFDDRGIQVPANLERQIAQRLDEKTFEPYLRGLLDWRKMEAAGVSLEGLSQHRKRVRQTFVDNLNQLSSNQRLILLLDTTDNLERTEVWDSLVSLILASKNTLFLLAGRNAKTLWASLQSELKQDALLIELTPLENKAGKEYLKQKQEQLYITLEPSLVDKLLFLAGGKPILIDLAVEWLSRDLPLDWMTQSSLEKLKSLSKIDGNIHEKEFEVQLVRHMTKIRTPMDRLTLAMSWIYPLTPAMIVKLLNVSKDEAKFLFDEVQTYVFVKLLPDGRITLHDEMRRLVNENVWPEIDSQEGRRRQYSTIAATLFQKEDNQLQKKLQEKSGVDIKRLFEREALVRDRQVVNQQWIEHALYSDAESGFDVWKRIVDQRRGENEFSFAKSLVDLASPYYEQFSSNQLFEFDLLKARLTNDTGQVREAEEMLNELLKKNRGEQEHEAELYNALGLVEEKLGKLSEALANQLKSLELFEKINPEVVPLVANRVGYIYRQLGKLEEAERYYKLALESALVVEAERRHMLLIASLLNNLAYISGLRREYRKLDFYIRQARDTWLDIGAIKEISRAESTRAIFFRDDGKYSEAIELFKRAISRYQEPDDNEQLCRTYLHLGWTQWYQAEIVNEEEVDLVNIEWNINLLNNARFNINKSLELSQKYNLKRLLPKILHQIASVYWYIGRAKKDSSLMLEARKLNAESHEKSKETGDLRYIIDSLLGEAEWDYEIGQYDKIEYESYRKILKEYEEHKDRYPLYFGRMDRIEGDIHLKRGKFEAAFAKYAEGLILINRHGGFSRYTIEREILRLENKMESYMSPEQIRKWVEYLYEKWSKVEYEDTDLLTTWSEGQILRAKLRSIG